MRRALAALFGLAALLAFAAPAHASEINVVKCISIADDGQGTAKACLSVNYTRTTGVTINAVRIYIAGDMTLLESNALDCDNLRLWNDNQVVWWRKDDNQCDLTKSTPSKTWYPDVPLPNSDHGNFGWTFYPHLNMARDPGYTHLSLSVS